jgi:hypothetical protein
MDQGHTCYNYITQLFSDSYPGFFHGKISTVYFQPCNPGGDSGTGNSASEWVIISGYGHINRSEQYV